MSGQILSPNERFSYSRLRIQPLTAALHGSYPFPQSITGKRIWTIETNCAGTSEQLAILKSGVDEWNAWREENPGVVIDVGN